MMQRQWGKGRIRSHQPGVMNKLEQAYEEHLKELLRQGKILWYAFEAIKLKLGDKCYYTPDFIVQVLNGELELHECKGFWQDDAKVKIKVAADKFPFRFRAFKQLSKKEGGGFFEEQIFNAEKSHE